MASPGELVLAVSEATGVPSATVTDMDRQLTKAGLRSKGGRGRSAAQMTPLDAARLLTALIAAPQAVASVEAVERYSDTRINRARSSDGLFAATDLEELSQLPARHGFVDMLAGLIAALSQDDDHHIQKIEVYAFTRATRGWVRFSGLPSGATVLVEYVPAPRGKSAAGRRNAEDSGDLEQSRRITDHTLRAIAQTLGTGGQHE